MKQMFFFTVINLKLTEYFHGFLFVLFTVHGCYSLSGFLRPM